MARVSKNSRTKSGQASKAISGTIQLLISCNGGTHAYVFDPADGTNKHLSTESPAFLERLGSLLEQGLGEKLSAELDDLVAAQPTSAWAGVRKQVAELGA